MRQESTHTVYQVEKIVEIKMCYKVLVVIEFGHHYNNQPKHCEKLCARSTWPDTEHSQHKFYRAIDRTFTRHNFFLRYCLYTRGHRNLGTLKE